MLKFIKSFFVGKPAEPEAPYKVEVPATSVNYEDIKPEPVKLTPASEQATEAVVESIAKPAKAKKTAGAKKPAAAKKVAKPKAPKAKK